jgi:ABC-2 type transport system permease protein
LSAKLWAIVKREYVERVRTKAFVIGTLLAPLLMGAMTIVPVMVARQSGKPLRVAVLDRSGRLGPAVENALRTARFDGKIRFELRPGGDASGMREAALKEAVLGDQLDGYLEIPEDVLGTSSARYYGRNVSNRIDLRTMELAVSETVVTARLAGQGLDPATVKDLTKDLDLKTIQLSESGEREDRGGTARMLAFVMLAILYVGILMWGQAVMTSVIEEKTSRVVEVMSAGVAPTVLLAGKLLGVGGAGLTQFLVWSLSLLGISLASAGPLASSFEMPEISALTLVSFLLFFLLGFLFYAALYAAIGAAVNTVQEAQNLVFPVMLPIIAGFVFFPAVLEAPAGPLAVSLSMIPGVSPLIMFLRIVVLTPPAWQIVLSIALMAAGIVGVLWVSARVYRVGILMYGKKPTFPELMRWVRHA